MINCAGKRILSLAIAVLLTVCTLLPASAAQVANKEEVVYVKLKHDGQVDTIYVVNSFDLSSGGQITDQGHYSEVRNLSTTDAISYSGGTVSVSAPAGKFYYEGVLENSEIPWDISVVWRLDGKQISGDRLAGQSGHLQINLDIRHRPGANEVYLDNYAMQVNLSLDSDTCTNIVAEDATIASVGNKKQLSYIIMPGKEGSFTITADVRDFEMDGISINGIPMNLNIDDPDTEELMDKVYELQDGAVELDDGAVELDDGATKLDDGVLSLEDGVAELEDGVEELQDGADDLRDGAQDIYDGTGELRDGVRNLDAGVSTLSGGAATFGSGLTSVDSQSETLTDGSEQVLEALETLDTALTGAGDGLPGQMAEQASSLQEGSRQYLEALDTMIAGYEQELKQSLSLGYSGTEDPAILQSNLQLLTQVRDSYLPVGAGVEAMTDTIVEQSGLLSSLVSGVRALLERYRTLHSGIIAYTQGVGNLSASFGSLVGGLSQLTDGVSDLQDGADELRSGARELYDGTWDLQDGVNRLTDGANELRDGATELRDGTLELKDGTLELLDGTQELREKTADLDTEVDERIDEMLDEYRGKDFTPVSFVNAENTDVKAVQFVIQTESITIEDDMAVETLVAEEPVETLSFWQKFINLFAFLKRS